NAVAVSDDGSIYIAEEYGFNVRRIGPDGIIESLAANLARPYGVAVGPDGSVYYGEASQQGTMPLSLQVVRRLHPDGTKSVAAGSDYFNQCGPSGCENGWGFAGDGGLATEAKLSWPRNTAAVRDGTLFIADTSNNRVRRVGPDGIITTIFGNGSY